jgi:hypothetical protein
VTKTRFAVSSLAGGAPREVRWIVDSTPLTGLEVIPVNFGKARVIPGDPLPDLAGLLRIDVGRWAGERQR